MDEMRKAYRIYHSTCGLKIGDVVKVLFKPTDFSGGWAHGFGAYKNKWVGAVGEISEDKEEQGFSVSFLQGKSCGGGFFPAFCLEKVVQPIKEMTLPEISKELGYEVKIVK